jgi:hypothetical protein
VRRIAPTLVSFELFFAMEEGLSNVRPISDQPLGEGNGMAHLADPLLRLHFIQHTPQTPVIHRHPILFPLRRIGPVVHDHLWRHVFPRSYNRVTVLAPRMQRAAGVQMRTAKVGNADVPANVNEEILWFDIAVNDPGGVDR